MLNIHIITMKLKVLPCVKIFDLAYLISLE